jgi:hypothetical protein
MYANPHRSESINPLIQSSLPSLFKQKAPHPPEIEAFSAKARLPEEKFKEAKSSSFLNKNPSFAFPEGF